MYLPVSTCLFQSESTCSNFFSLISVQTAGGISDIISSVYLYYKQTFNQQKIKMRDAKVSRPRRHQIKSK